MPQALMWPGRRAAALRLCTAQRVRQADPLRTDIWLELFVFVFVA
jgi:hypothetical protein